jgi:ABC-2 type transport system permease protein
MQGKIIGHFFLGLIQLTFWIVLSLPAVVYFLEFPVMEALAETNLVVIILFGTLGYLLFSSLYVSMGATMDDLQSANNSQGIVLMIPMLSFLFISPVVNNPNGLIARFAGLFPITSPVIMILRNAMTHVPAGEIILSLAILAATSYFLMRLGGKVFRIGMLMYGKTATFPEILKWLRYKES